MSHPELAILLPCHSLEDFPHYHEGEAAAGLLANWTALWHPALLAGRSRGPTWYRADDPPDAALAQWLLVPSVSEPELPVEFADRAESADGRLFLGYADRNQLLREILSGLEIADTYSADLVGDFLALGYAYLQIQLLTRQMRYSSNLDEGHFSQQLVAAADAGAAGDADTAQAKLSACFDLLAEERDHYYSVDAYLLDLTLLDESLVGDPAKIEEELEQPAANNLLAAAAVLHALSEQSPKAAAVLKERLGNGMTGLVGGEHVEDPLPQLSCEAVLSALQRGRESYQQILGQTPTVFGRRCYGLTPLLPSLLDRLGYTGALHFTLADGTFPQGSQVKTRWEGCDGVAVDALAKVPLDASKPETFLSFAHCLGESMDMDHVATVTFAHWPGKTCCWYDDLRRSARFGSVLGQFVTIENYFGETYTPGHSERFSADAYVSPYLRAAVESHESDPVSSRSRQWRDTLTQVSTSGLEMLVAATGGNAKNVAATSGDVDIPPLAQRFAEQLPRNGDDVSGILVLNPLSCARRVVVDASSLDRLPGMGKPMYAVDPNEKQVVVDVPAMGFTWVSESSGGNESRKPRAPLVEDRSKSEDSWLLRNEYFEVVVDNRTGGLRAVKDYQHRDNRLSQQIARRRTERAPTAHRQRETYYSTMVAESVVATESNAVTGAVTSRGKLIDQERVVGEFEQVVRATLGSRVLEVELTLSSLVELDVNPWESYYAARFAWPDEAAELFAGCHELRQLRGGGRIESPQYIEIDTATRRTALLVDGLPYHRRTGPRMLDSLLVVRGERVQTFRWGIALDAPSPLDQARQFSCPPICIPQRCGAPTPAPSSWLFHIDAKNVSATSWQPIYQGGALSGVRIRVLESMGRSTRAKLSSFRPFRHARRVDFRGQSLGDLRVAEGRAYLELAASEWAEFEVGWDEPQSGSSP